MHSHRHHGHSDTGKLIRLDPLLPHWGLKSTGSVTQSSIQYESPHDHQTMNTHFLYPFSSLYCLHNLESDRTMGQFDPDQYIFSFFCKNHKVKVG